MIEMRYKLLAIWAYRGFVFGSVKREFKARYANSLLGGTWAVLNPLAMILVYTLIFSHVMRTKLVGVDNAFAYSIYLCAGVLPWAFFSEVIGRGQNIFLEHANMIKKLSFPRIVLPLIVVMNAGLNFAIIFSLFTGFLVISGNFPGWIYLAVVPVLILQILFSVGLATIFAVLNVFFRDVGQFAGIMLQFWFWLTPIVYPASIIPERFRPLVALNPMTDIIVAYQGIMLAKVQPDWMALAPTAVVGIALCAVGWRLFRKRSAEMVDEL